MIRFTLDQEDDIFNESLDDSDEYEVIQEVSVGRTLMGDADYDAAVDNYKKTHQGEIGALGKAGIAAAAANDTMGNIKYRGDRFINRNKVDTRSIISRAKNSVCQFPVYISSGVPYDVAHAIAKTFERVYATYVQIELSQNQIVSEHELNGLQFLRRHHTNLKESSNPFFNEYYEPIDDFDKMMVESVHNVVKVSDDTYVEFNMVPTVDEDLILENARLSHEPLYGLTYLKENNTQFTIKDILTDGEVRSAMRKLNDPNVQTIEDLAKAISKGRTVYTTKKDKNGNPQLVEIKCVKPSGSDDYIFTTGEIKGSTDANKVLSGPSVPRLLKDADIKKINGMLPLTIEATFRVAGSNGMHDVSYIIGVKTILHLISYKDLSEDLRDIINGNQRSLRKIRYKTGELSWWEYMFNVKGLKSDASKHINHNKRWLNNLKRLGEYNNIGGSILRQPAEFLTNSDIPIPNATLILTQPEVDAIIDETGIDIVDVDNAKRIGTALFLIAIAIVDATDGTMKVLYPDRDNAWDIQSLKYINAEVSRMENNKLIAELNKMINT